MISRCLAWWCQAVAASTAGLQQVTCNALPSTTDKSNKTHRRVTPLDDLCDITKTAGNSTSSSPLSSERLCWRGFPYTSGTSASYTDCTYPQRRRTCCMVDNELSTEQQTASIPAACVPTSPRMPRRPITRSPPNTWHCQVYPLLQVSRSCFTCRPSFYSPSFVSLPAFPFRGLAGRACAVYISHLQKD